MTTSSTINCKSYYVCDKDNFNLFCAAALCGLISVFACPEELMSSENCQDTARRAADYAEAMMAEFQKRRMTP